MDTVKEIRKLYGYSELNQSEFLKLVKEAIGFKQDQRFDSAETFEFTSVQTPEGTIIVGIEND